MGFSADGILPSQQEPQPQELQQGLGPRLTDTYLAHPTEDEQLDQMKANSKEWRGPLSLSAYLKREDALSHQELTKDGGITFWALVGHDGSQDPESRQMVAGCESIHKRALFCNRGLVEDAVCHGIASVFARPEYRGKGYGEELIRRLAKALGRWQPAQGQNSFSVLYSDIGKKFYAKNGWHPYLSSHMLLPPDPGQPSSEGERVLMVAREPQSRQAHEIRCSLPPVQSIGPSMIADLCNDDERLLRRKMAARPHDRPPAVAIVPDAPTMRWHHAREELVATHLLGKTPSVKGAIAVIPPSVTEEHTRYDKEGKQSSVSSMDITSSTPAESRRVWALWVRTWQNADPKRTAGNKLHILRIVIEPRASSGGFEDDGFAGDKAEVHAIMSVLREAQRQASLWHMGAVEIWNPCQRVVEAVQNLSLHRPHEYPDAAPIDLLQDPTTQPLYGQVVHREKDSITSLQWFGTGDGPLNEFLRSNPEHLEWMENEKFGWC